MHACCHVLSSGGNGHPGETQVTEHENSSLKKANVVQHKPRTGTGAPRKESVTAKQTGPSLPASDHGGKSSKKIDIPHPTIKPGCFLQVDVLQLIKSEDESLKTSTSKTTLIPPGVSGSNTSVTQQKVPTDLPSKPKELSKTNTKVRSYLEESRRKIMYE